MPFDSGDIVQCRPVRSNHWDFCASIVDLLFNNERDPKWNRQERMSRILGQKIYTDSR